MAAPDWSDPQRNTAAALFRLEHHRDEQDMLAVLASLVGWLQAPEQTGLRRAFTVWIRRVLLPYRAPDMELPEFNDLQELQEVHHMLAERVKKWPDRWIAKGREEGLEQGLERGLEQGLEKGLEQGRKSGREEGRRQQAHDAARKLIAMGLLSDEQIAEATGLALTEIWQLRGEGRE